MDRRLIYGMYRKGLPMLENLHWLGHDSFRIADPTNGKQIYLDPFKLEKHEPKADLVLITHDHFDHYSPDDLAPLLKPETVIVTVASVADLLAKQNGPWQVVTVKPGDQVTAAGYPIEAVPAYNTNKYREPGQHFHPKSSGFVGFVITVGGQRIYHTGDSDVIPEMTDVEADVALIPVSGTYVMTPEEAVEAATRIGAQTIVPMHYGAIVATEAEARQFAAACKQKGLDVHVLEKTT
jgi:L-ascorbate metabolism protein UlaG (beta-lactamase superfamily)